VLGKEVRQHSYYLCVLEPEESEPWSSGGVEDGARGTRPIFFCSLGFLHGGTISWRSNLSN